MKNKKIRCDIYTRVSTTMQVDGYSLDAQKEKLKRYAEFQNMEIVNEYSDEGKSGKSVEGRPEFQRMLDNIENGTDEVQFVLVFKLSRFGRNAADVLNSLQRMQDFGVNLICVEDGIDSSKDSGKLMISVLSAVAEIERENILVQTMEGRKQKAREGKWNGGFAPYGYELVNGELQIAEDEVEIIRLIYDKFIHTNMGISAIAAWLNQHGYKKKKRQKLVNGELQIAEDEVEIIRLIYDKFIHTNMGISAIAAWLNQHGYKKKKRQNNTLDAFAASFIKGVLDNPVYCGKLAYGRRKNEKVSGTRNEYRIVKQENYMLHDGIHEGIISETDWELAHQKREKTGVKYEKTHSLDHEHILSGILRCPLCGSGMYGNVNRKKKKDGTLYKDYFYYACKHRRLVDGHKCGYRKQWSEEKINNAVEEVIRKLVKNPKFEEAILNKIGSRIDTEEIEKEIERLEKQHRQLTGVKARLGQQMDSLDIMDKFYEKKYQDMETRLYRLYDEIEGVENSIEEVKNRLLNIRQQKISEENVYQFLLYFDKLYDKFTDLEKKEFLNSFVEQVDIYEQEQPDGRFLKHIKFRFPVYFGDRETQELCWDNESTVETVCLLNREN
jgi:site-specific DNA recombinase